MQLICMYIHTRVRVYACSIYSVTYVSDIVSPVSQQLALRGCRGRNKYEMKL